MAAVFRLCRLAPSRGRRGISLRRGWQNETVLSGRALRHPAFHRGKYGRVIAVENATDPRQR
ncbi:hypothetical protein ABIE78_001252 [Sinorhizobium fredii]